MAKAPRELKEFERHVLSAGYPDITGQDWLDFVDNLKRIGDRGRCILLFEGKVLDGWQFYRAWKELRSRNEVNWIPDFDEFTGNQQEAEDYVVTANQHRRHESAETMQRRARDRRDRVAKLRAAGDSIRKIAEQEGVGKTTVERDLESATVPPGTPETPSGESHAGNGKPKKPPKRKSGTALKPPKLCARCKRIGSASCDGCRKKQSEYEDARDKLVPPTPEPGLDFEGAAFLTMRDFLQGLLDEGQLLRSRQCDLGEANTPEWNGIKKLGIEIENNINQWANRLKKKRDKAEHERGRSSAHSERR